MQPGVAAIKNIPVASQFYWPAPIGTPLYVTGLSEWLAGRGERVIGLIDDPDKRAEIGAQGGSTCRGESGAERGAKAIC